MSKWDLLHAGSVVFCRHLFSPRRSVWLSSRVISSSRPLSFSPSMAIRHSEQNAPSQAGDRRPQRPFNPAWAKMKWPWLSSAASSLGGSLVLQCPEVTNWRFRRRCQGERPWSPNAPPVRYVRNQKPTPSPCWPASGAGIRPGVQAGRPINGSWPRAANPRLRSRMRVSFATPVTSQHVTRPR